MIVLSCAAVTTEFTTSGLSPSTPICVRIPLGSRIKFITKGLPLITATSAVPALLSSSIVAVILIDSATLLVTIILACPLASVVVVDVLNMAEPVVAKLTSIPA